VSGYHLAEKKIGKIMRKGQNPAKFVNSVAKPSPITVAVLSYIPFLSGFYTEGLEILKICLNSIFLEKNYSFDVLVFDNGSCDEVISYLVKEHQSKIIQYLILSEKNLGKGGAWNIIFDAAPGDYIVYLDSDVKFRENWLSESMKIINTYPNVGMVTARPFFSKKEYLSSTYKWAKKTPDVNLENGKLITWKDFYDFNFSLGQDPKIIEEDYENTTFERITFKEVSVIAGASHWQFLTKKEVIRKLMPFDMDRPMGLVKQLDEKINEAGYLRLMVNEPLAENISNSLENSSPNTIKDKKRLITRILHNRFCKKILLFIYNQIFEIYYKN
jgi:glycosyltransferase involved in cell wall biosynthesis